jgi:hypothetical protein
MANLNLLRTMGIAQMEKELIKNFKLAEKNSPNIETTQDYSEENVKQIVHEVLQELKQKEFGILDHGFIGSGGDSWTVYCRLIKNAEDATVSRTFIRPEVLSKEEFERQLLNFEIEMQGWKKALED